MNSLYRIVVAGALLLIILVGVINIWAHWDTLTSSISGRVALGTGAFIVGVMAPACLLKRSRRRREEALDQAESEARDEKRRQHERLLDALRQLDQVQLAQTYEEIGGAEHFCIVRWGSFRQRKSGTARWLGSKDQNIAVVKFGGHNGLCDTEFIIVSGTVGRRDIDFPGIVIRETGSYSIYETTEDQYERMCRKRNDRIKAEQEKKKIDAQEQVLKAISQNLSDRHID